MRKRKEIDKMEALGKLESLCARSEQCVFDLNRKMINWGIKASDRKEIIENLIENRYVDESRYARSFANDKARFSCWGPYKIRMELMKKRLMSSLISEAVKNVDPEVWKEGLLHAATVKARNLDLTGEDGWENGQKLYKYLIGRGFPSAASSKAVNVMRKREESSGEKA